MKKTPLPSPFSIDQSTYRGKVADLTRPGAAEPFLQPWYTPIACTPRDTGLPMGGIGSAFTLTPAGTTPIFSGLGGLHITPKPDEDFNLHSFYFAERKANPNPEDLVVKDAGAILRCNRFYALVNAQGKPWLLGQETEAEVAATLKAMAADIQLYPLNATALKRWHIDFSPRTQAALKKSQGHDESQSGSIQLSISILLDLFGGSIILKPNFQSTLTGALNAEGQAGISNYPMQSMEYVGLYPLAKTEYTQTSHALRISKTCYSPILRGEEKWCSLPVSGTSFHIENPSQRPLEATLAFTLENFIGDAVIKARPGAQDAWFHLLKTAHYPIGKKLNLSLGSQRQAQGFVLEQETGKSSGDMQGHVTALVEVSNSQDENFWVSVEPNAYALQEKSLVAEALGTGKVNCRLGEPHLSTGRERRIAILCVTVVIPAGQSREIHFSLALDLPDITLRGMDLQKKYTHFFPEPVGRSEAMAAELLRERKVVLERIASDHAAIAQSGSMPQWLTSGDTPTAHRLLTQMANHLGFLADATLWDTQDHFWIRECADYPFFNSLDVYFYGSFSVLHLLPRLDGCVLREFSDAILAEDTRRRRHWEYMFENFADLPEERLEGQRGIRGAVPHDMGSPFDPSPDAYIWHNVKHWKDLAPKYLLMVWRHYHLTHDETFLRACWPAAKLALEYLDAMREEGQPMPLTDGTDDTFDNLESRGVSIYCGSLWAAALAVGEAMAKTLGETETAKAWQAMGTVARQALRATLWNEEQGTYRFWVDERNQTQSEDVFADQLLADLWLRLLGLPPLTPDADAKRAAQSVLSRNWKKHSPWVGAANLVGPQGETLPAFQAQDVWMGVQYSLAATCLQLGLSESAWELLDLCYDHLYEKARIPFGAPEGFNGSVSVTPEKLAQAAQIKSEEARQWIQALQAKQMLDQEARPLALSQGSLESFLKNLQSSSLPQAHEVHAFLQSHSLQYTAGRYLRPGMIWALTWPAAANSK